MNVATRKRIYELAVKAASEEPGDCMLPFWARDYFIAGAKAAYELGVAEERERIKCVFMDLTPVSRHGIHINISHKMLLEILNPKEPTHGA